MTTEAGQALLARVMREGWQVSVLYDQPNLSEVVAAIEAEARAAAEAQLAECQHTSVALFDAAKEAQAQVAELRTALSATISAFEGYSQDANELWARRAWALAVRRLRKITTPTSASEHKPSPASPSGAEVVAATAKHGALQRAVGANED